MPDVILARVPLGIPDCALISSRLIPDFFLISLNVSSHIFSTSFSTIPHMANKRKKDISISRNKIQ